MFNPAFLGGVAKSAKARQDLRASQVPAAEPKEFFIQWPGSPFDGMRATLHSSVPGEAIVILASGRKASVPTSNLVAAPKAPAKEKKKEEEEATDKTKKVVPDDKPDTRGTGAQEEELTDRAKAQSKEMEKPPVLEHMKKGPKDIDVEMARTAAEAEGPLATLVAAAEAAEVAANTASEAAKAAQAKVGEAKSEEAKAVKLVVEEMEKTGTVVAKIKDRLVGLDKSKNVAAVNIPKTGSLRTRYDQALSLLKSIQGQAADQAKVLKEIEAEAEEQYGATYNVQKRVSLFPASLQAALKSVAGFMEMVKGIAEWVKGLFGIAEDAEKAVDGLEEELKAAGEGVSASIVAAAPISDEDIDSFVDENSEEAIKYLKDVQVEEVSAGRQWNPEEAHSLLFEFLSEKWADKHGAPYLEGDDANPAFEDDYFVAFDKAMAKILERAKEHGVMFETAKFPEAEKVHARLAAMTYAVMAHRMLAAISPELQSRIEAAMENGSDAFWAEVVKVFPEAKFGDFGPDQHMAFEAAMEEAITGWVRNNVPGATAEIEAAAKATSEGAQDFISKEIEHLIKDKGYESDRAKGAAYNIARRKGYKVGKKKVESALVKAWYDSLLSDEGRKGASLEDLEKAAGDLAKSQDPKDAEELRKVSEEIELRKAGHVEAAKLAESFKAFSGRLKARTGLSPLDAGIHDEQAFSSVVAAEGAEAWITGFIKAHGLRDLSSAARA